MKFDSNIIMVPNFCIIRWSNAIKPDEGYYLLHTQIISPYFHRTVLYHNNWFIVNKVWDLSTNIPWLYDNPRHNYKESYHLAYLDILPIVTKEERGLSPRIFSIIFIWLWWQSLERTSIHTWFLEDTLHQSL